MKRRSTFLKAAPGIFLAFMIGSSCQKEATLPANTVELSAKTTTQSQLETVAKYPMQSPQGNEVGHMELNQHGKLAGIIISVNGGLAATSDDLLAWLVKSDTKIVRLERFYGMPEVEKTPPGTGSATVFYTSISYPVTDVKTGHKFTVDELRSGVYKVVVTNKADELLAIGAFR